MGKIVEASGFVIMTRANPQKLLLLQQSDRWDLPKGHVNAGENLLAAALRETEEETGIAPDAINVDGQFQFVIEYPLRSARRGKYTKRVTYFLGIIDQTLPIRLTEHESYQWVDWPVLGPIQKKTIDPLLDQLKKHLDEVDNAR